MIRLFAWFIERLLEFIAACFLTMLVYGPSNSPRFQGWTGEFELAGIAVSFFYIVTGYLFTTLVPGWIERIGFGWRRPPAIATLFLLHFALFCLFSGRLPEHGIALGLGGAVISGLAATATVLLFRRRTNRWWPAGVNRPAD